MYSWRYNFPCVIFNPPNISMFCFFSDSWTCHPVISPHFFLLSFDELFFKHPSWWGYFVFFVQLFCNSNGCNKFFTFSSTSWLRSKIIFIFWKRIFGLLKGMLDQKCSLLCYMYSLMFSSLGRHREHWFKDFVCTCCTMSFYTGCLF